MSRCFAASAPVLIKALLNALLVTRFPSQCRILGHHSLIEEHFLELMAERQIEKRFKRQILDGVCLLCSEDKPHHCHRCLVCEYLNEKWGGALEVNCL